MFYVLKRSVIENISRVKHKFIFLWMKQTNPSSNVGWIDCVATSGGEVDIVSGWKLCQNVFKMSIRNIIQIIFFDYKPIKQELCQTQ